MKWRGRVLLILIELAVSLICSIGIVWVLSLMIPKVSFSWLGVVAVFCIMIIAKLVIQRVLNN